METVLKLAGLEMLSLLLVVIVGLNPEAILKPPSFCKSFSQLLNGFRLADENLCQPRDGDAFLQHPEGIATFIQCQMWHGGIKDGK